MNNFQNPYTHPILYKRYNILIVDNSRLFRDGLSLALEQIKMAENVYHAENGDNVQEYLGRIVCDIVFIDYCLPAMNGAICTREIKRAFPKVKVIGMSIFKDQEHMINMFNNGADGFLMKNMEIEEIEFAIKSVVNGKRYFSKEFASSIISKILVNSGAGSTEQFKCLNGRDRSILQLLYEEYSGKEIADKLSISERTVEFYRQRLIKKTGARNIVGLVKYAMQHKIIKETANYL